MKIKHTTTPPVQRTVTYDLTGLSHRQYLALWYGLKHLKADQQKSVAYTPNLMEAVEELGAEMPQHIQWGAA